MEDTTKKTINVLNNLLEINNDRIEGYKKAVQETEDTDLKKLFTALAETSYACKLELTAEIEKLGGEPVEGTRNTGKLYRVWMDIKAALTNHDRRAILNSCEMGEDVAVKNYEDAVKHFEIATDLHKLIQKQYNMIQTDHNQIKRLRDSFVNA